MGETDADHQTSRKAETSLVDVAPATVAPRGPSVHFAGPATRDAADRAPLLLVNDHSPTANAIPTAVIAGA